MLKKVYFFILALLPLASLSIAQTPGGVTGNLTLWLKANTGVTTVGTSVSAWAEQSGGPSGDFATQGAVIGMGTQNQPTYVPGALNFNPQISFVQVGPTSITSNNAFPGLSMFDQYDNTILQVIKLHTMTSTGVFFKWQYLNTNTQRVGFETNPSSNPGKMRFDFRGINNYSNTNINDKYYITNSLTDINNSTIRLNGAVDKTMAYSGQAAFAPTTDAHITLGNEQNGDPYPTTIDYTEVIIFSRTLTAAERNQVESYVAVKYGFTLDQSVTYANDYTSANSTVIWDHAANLPYVNNITGIGRDDNSALTQNQSKSINTAGIVTVYNGAYIGSTFPVLNTDNATPFTADNSFLLFGDNALDTAENICFAGNPGLLRMNRVWKFQETGTINTVTLAVGTGDVPTGTKHLLVSTDAGFAPASTTIYPLTLDNNILSASITLPVGGYFTYAADSLIAHGSSDAPVCQGGTIQFTGTTIAGAVTQWTGPNFTSNTLNPTLTNAQPSDSGRYILSGTISGCTIYPDTLIVVVHANPLAPVVTSPVNYCQGAVAVPLSATGQNLAYLLPPAYSQPGTITAPTPATNITGDVLYYAYQSVNGCKSDTAAIHIITNAKPAPPTVSSPSYCQGEVAVPLVANGQNLLFYAPPTYTPGQATPPTPSTSAIGATPYFVTQKVNGCRSDSATINVVVVAKPATPVITSNTPVCEGSILSVGVTSSPGASFSWMGPDSFYSTVQNFSLQGQPGQSGQYSVVALVSGCASDTARATITVNPTPANPVTANISYCQGSVAVPLTAVGQNLQWYSAPGGGATFGSAPVPSTATVGVTIYFVSQTVNGCESHRAALNVTVYLTPTPVITSSKSSVCIFDTATFIYNGVVNPGDSIGWDFPIGTQVTGSPASAGPLLVKFDSSGLKTIYLTVKSASGCMATASFIIKVVPLPDASFTLKADACVNEQVPLALANSSIEAVNFVWDFVGGNVISRSENSGGPYFISFTAPGLYVPSLIASTQEGCISKRTMDTILIHELPAAAIKQDLPLPICASDSVLFSVTPKDPGYKYTWTPERYFNNFNSSDIYGTVAMEGYVYVDVTSEYGCTGRDSILVTTKPCCALVLPTAFSPNGDGKNDVFRAQSLGHHNVHLFEIQNRWGQTVYSSANDVRGWNGTFNGVPQDVGVYYYYIKFDCTEGNTVEQKGEVTLVR